MNQQWNRRDVWKGLVSASTALVIARGQGTAPGNRVRPASGDTDLLGKGEWMGTQTAWDDTRKILGLRLAPGSRMSSPKSRASKVQLAEVRRNSTFDGKPVEVSF